MSRSDSHEDASNYENHRYCFDANANDANANANANDDECNHHGDSDDEPYSNVDDFSLYVSVNR